jgi:hypothetical protein
MLIHIPERIIHQVPRGLISLAEWGRQAERRWQERQQWSASVRAAKRLRMMDGAFYWDSRAPFLAADAASVTLAATDKALYVAGLFPNLGGNYFSWIGKAILIRLFGRITTGATPGNLTWDIYWGTGADANGTILQSSAAVALVASQTNLSWTAEFVCRCRTIPTPTTGTLFVTGIAQFNVAVMASTNQPQLIPASAPATSGSVDLTANNIVSVQTKRSGSTGESMQVHELAVVALN